MTIVFTPETVKKFSDVLCATDSVGAAIEAVTPPLDVQAASRPFLLDMLHDRRPTRRLIAVLHLIEHIDQEVRAVLCQHAETETCVVVRNTILEQCRD